MTTMDCTRVSSRGMGIERDKRQLLVRDPENNNKFKRVGGMAMAGRANQGFALGTDVTGTTGLTGPNAPTSAGDAGPLLEGIRTEFLGTYMMAQEQTEAFWKRVLFRTVPVHTSYYQYTYPESAPHPVRQPRNTAPASGQIRYRGNRLDVHAFASRVYHHLDDVADDQTGSVFNAAGRAGTNFGLLMLRIAAQLLTESTDTTLLPSVGTAADGVGLASATDGDGSARFGVTGGNIVSLGTSPTPSDIRSWIYDIRARWRNMKDTKGQQLFDPSFIDEGIMLIHGPSLELEMREALMQRRVFQVDGTVGSANAAAAPSNVVIDSGTKIETYSTPYITDNKVLAILTSDKVERPCIWGERQALYEVYADEPVSDYVRDTQQAYLQFRTRLLAGYHLPYALISGGAGS